MSQRRSEYPRKLDENYETIAWPVLALLPHIRGNIERTWDPCDRGSGRMVTALRSRGIDAIGTNEDFLTTTATPSTSVTDIICNPPYGASKRGELALAFIEHALALMPPLRRAAMLLRADFDSAISRQHVFRNCPAFAGKVILLNRIKWFEGPKSPSDNHAWFLWSCIHIGSPAIYYATRAEAETMFKPESAA